MLRGPDEYDITWLAFKVREESINYGFEGLVGKVRGRREDDDASRTKAVYWTALLGFATWRKPSLRVQDFYFSALCCLE